MNSSEESALIKYMFGFEDSKDRKILQNLDRRLDKWEKIHTSFVKDAKKTVNKRSM